jgi:iron-sulfur cluster assembly accessory protein
MTLFLLLIVVLSTLALHAAYSFRSTLRFAPSVSRHMTVVSEASSEGVELDDSVLFFTSNAMKQLDFLQSKQDDKLVLRMGVQAGGCSGMTYVMDFVGKADVTEEDHVESFDGVQYAIDPKSLMFLYGMQLDYSDELIGGGFKFQNPNAETSCGCGKSFGV